MDSDQTFMDDMMVDTDSPSVDDAVACSDDYVFYSDF